MSWLGPQPFPGPPPCPPGAPSDRRRHHWIERSGRPRRPPIRHHRHDPVNVDQGACAKCASTGECSRFRILRDHERGIRLRHVGPSPPPSSTTRCGPADEERHPLGARESISPQLSDRHAPHISRFCACRCLCQHPANTPCRQRLLTRRCIHNAQKDVINQAFLSSSARTKAQ
jgi:hypothetical protein